MPRHRCADYERPFRWKYALINGEKWVKAEQVAEFLIWLQQQNPGVDFLDVREGIRQALLED
jgi:hypothetical protein